MTVALPNSHIGGLSDGRKEQGTGKNIRAGVYHLR
jgi:hypothetical protein